MKTTHVVPDGKGGWNVKQGGSQRASANFNTKQPAIDRARELSRNQGSELFIHKKNGQIGSKDSHGKDSFPPRG